jgi:hypothetical protein
MEEEEEDAAAAAVNNNLAGVAMPFPWGQTTTMVFYILLLWEKMIAKRPIVVRRLTVRLKLEIGS